jgi:hypothetical protein
MSALPAAPAPVTALWRSAPMPASTTGSLAMAHALRRPVPKPQPLRPAAGLGLDEALGWDGVEARLSPVIGQHGLVALYHRSVALARRARGPQAPLAPAQAFFQLLTELLGAELAERLLPDAAQRR